MTASPAITLLHATPVAMQPIRVAFSSIWPDAVLTDLLDDGLTSERARSAHLTEALVDRFVRLAQYGYRNGTDAILVTCSAFGPAIERVAADLPIPVIKPNEAMFRAAMKLGRRIAMLATFAPSLPTMEAEFQEAATQADSPATLTTILVEGAMDHLRRGDVVAHNRLVAERAAALRGYDALLLAHFSTAQAGDAVRSVTDVPVFTAPESAVRQLQARMEASP